MNYIEAIKALKKATAFDLFLLRHAINNVMDDPAWLQQIKGNLQVGQIIEYYQPSEDKLTQAKLTKINQTSAEVINIHDKQHCVIDLYTIKLETSVKTDNTKTKTKQTNNNNVNSHSKSLYSVIANYGNNKGKIKKISITI